jgi:anthranilate synthase/aminodeoxychorismate synthase-like glutamine amidotransferase
VIYMLDNYDSFTYNLVQYLGELGAELEVVRNDKTTTADVLASKPDGIVVSPGPCTPNEAGISTELIAAAAGKVPILGVCLGHQCIGQVFGGEIVRADTLMHGKTSLIHHQDEDVFLGLENPFVATRYHSLIIDPQTMPAELDVTARADDGAVMSVRHREFPIYGVQFHPESILTVEGMKLLQNFLNIVEQHRANGAAANSTDKGAK